MITTTELREILSASGTLIGIDDAGDDDELHMDSFSLVWLQHALLEQHRVDLDLRDVHADEFASLRRMQDYINTRRPGASDSAA